MEELEVFSKLEEISAVTQYGDLFGDDAEKAKQIANHKAWLQSIRHERPSTPIKSESIFATSIRPSTIITCHTTKSSLQILLPSARNGSLSTSMLIVALPLHIWKAPRNGVDYCKTVLTEKLI